MTKMCYGGGGDEIIVWNFNSYSKSPGFSRVLLIYLEEGSEEEQEILIVCWLDVNRREDPRCRFSHHLFRGEKFLCSKKYFLLSGPGPAINHKYRQHVPLSPHPSNSQ